MAKNLVTGRAGVFVCLRLLLPLLGIGILSGSAVASGRLSDLDRTGAVFISPKFGFTFPVGALADGNYRLVASSWRKEGISLTGEVGYYLTNSSAWGLEISYSTFGPKMLTAFADPEIQDKSRVRIRRFGVFFQYQMVPSGKYRPFVKLGAGLFDVSRISMPQPDADPIEYKDYSLGGKPVFSAGAGFTAYLSGRLSAAISVEAVSLNSFSAAWETTGASVGPLKKNMLFFPAYFSILYHFSE